MEEDRLLCLGKFKTHSCDPWRWMKDKKMYFRECALMGCEFSETSAQLIPVGKTDSIGQPDSHEHDWDVWKDRTDQYGLYTPPYLYKRECRVCKFEQVAENLGRSAG